MENPIRKVTAGSVAYLGGGGRRKVHKYKMWSFKCPVCGHVETNGYYGRPRMSTRKQAKNALQWHHRTKHGGPWLGRGHASERQPGAVPV